MRDDLGFGPRRPRRVLGLSTAVMVVTAVLVVVLLALAQNSEGTGHDASWRGGDGILKRRLPLPGLLPSQAPAPSTTVPTDPGAPPPAAAPRPAAAVPLTVTYVYDGDTIQARAHQPNDVVPEAGPIRIRLIGIDAPEGTPSPECWADEARTHLAELLPEGSTVWAAPDAELHDRYGRWLFHLWTDDGRFVNHALVSAGDAEAMRVWPNVEYDELLTAAEAEAEASRAGRWGPCG